MSDKKPAAGSDNDVLRIRDILFGEQMHDYSNRFAANDNRMNDLQAQLNSQREHFDQQMQQAQAHTQRQIEELKAALTARLDQLAFDKTTRADLGAMLVELGESIRRDPA
ncbi:MAG: hypothetical protein J5I90_18205 [Caldilineales bacterium]|nr:hypothetical protein [Caldilineales bacterium]